MQRHAGRKSQDNLLIISLLIKGEYQEMLNVLKSCLVMGMRIDSEFEMTTGDFIRLLSEYRTYADSQLSDSNVNEMRVRLFRSKAEILVSLNFLIDLFDNLSLFKAYYRVALNEIEGAEVMLNDENPAPSAPPYYLVQDVIDSLNVVPSAPAEEVDDVSYTGMTSSILFPRNSPVNQVALSQSAAQHASINSQKLDNNLTICIVGDSCSGKTELLKAYANDDVVNGFKYGNTNCWSKQYDLFGNLWKVLFIDISNYIQYTKPNQMILYKKAQAFIVTLDIYDKNSLNRVDKYIQQIISYKEEGIIALDAYIILALTKCDLLEKRVIKADEINSLLNKYDNDISFHVETSSRSLAGVEHLFSTTIEWMAEHRLRNTGKVVEPANLEPIQAESNKGCIIC
jgi:GTPase SAR1 family protein